MSVDGKRITGACLLALTLLGCEMRTPPPDPPPKLVPPKAVLVPPKAVLVPPTAPVPASTNPTPRPAAPLARALWGAPQHRYSLPGAPQEPADARQTEIGRLLRVDLEPGKTRVRMPLQPNETLWGFGQRLDAFNLRGLAFEIWAEDGWNRTDTSYFAVPWYISSRGYGLFINSTGRLKVDLGRSTSDELQIEIPEEGVEVWLLTGTPAEILSTYSALVGRPHAVPDWTFRPWLSRNSYLSAYEVDRHLVLAEKNGLKVGAVVLESWEKHLHNFQFETNRYPDPAGWMRTLQQRGVHVVCWTTASIWTGDPTHEHARDHGYLVRQADGSDYITRWLENGRKMDFRIPAARDWWRDLHQPLIKMGVGGFKTDGGEHMPDPWFHNEHPFPYQRATLDAYAAAGRTGITFARSANPLCAGNSTFWGGDQHADWSNLAAVVHGGLSAAWSGFFYWSHDVGGYTGVAEKNLYLRWLQIGAFSPMMQLHGIPAREPWHYDRETLDLARGYFKVREQLQPYLVDLAREAREQGHPMWRPLAWAYPHDENTWSLGDQFLLGPDLLVAPVLSSNETRSIYVPEGEWLDLWTQATIRGPTRLTTQVERAAIPVYARAESAARWRQLLRAVPRPEPSPFRMELAGPRNERGLVPEQRYVADGGVETIAYTLHNQSPVPAVGTLTLKLPPGFACEPNHHTFELAPGTSTERSFALATPRGLEPGSYTIQGLCRIGNLAAKTPKVHVIRSPAWKVLGLFPLAMGAPHELDGKRPDLNARWTVREGDLLWQDLPAEKLGADGWVDLSWLTTREHLATAYAFTTVASPGTRRAVIKSGSGDALTIWLNGQEISRREVCRNPERDEDAADVVLRGGVNTILVRHSRGLAPSGFYFRLAEPER